MEGKTWKNRLRSTTGEILGIMFDIASDLGQILLDAPKRPYRQLYNLFPDEFARTRNPYRDFYNLKKQGYITVSEKEGLTAVTLTNKARMKLIDKISAKQGKDGFYHFISFDIPEPMRRNRNGFRRTIKRMGFREVQKSLWVCDKSIGDLVELAAAEYEVRDYVVYLVAQKSNIDSLLKKMVTKKKSLRAIMDSCSADL